MAMTIDSLAKLMRKALGPDFRFEVDAQHSRIVTNIAMETYRDQHGEDGMDVVIALRNEGRYVEVETPALYSLAGCGNTYAVLRLLLGVCWRTNVVQFSLDEADGEVRASAELVLADNVLTVEQLHEILNEVVFVINAFHPHVVHAMQTGVVTFPKEPEVRSVLPAAPVGAPPGLAAMDVDTEEMLRSMLRDTRARLKETWRGTKPDVSAMRHW